MRRFFSWLWRRWRSPKWHARDGRVIRVADMTDGHILNCLKAIHEQRLFPTDDVTDLAGDAALTQFLLAFNKIQLKARARWRRVFSDELAVRGVSA